MSLKHSGRKKRPAPKRFDTVQRILHRIDPLSIGCADQGAFET